MQALKEKTIEKGKVKCLTYVIAISAILCIATSVSIVNAQQSPIIGTFSDNLAQIQIYSVTTSTNIAYYPYSTEYNGYVWVILDISIKNVASTGTISTNSLYGYLKDNQGLIYRGRSLANDPQDLKLITLNPGDSQRGNLYFEIPATSNIVGFYWDDYRSNIAFPSTIQAPALPTAMASKSDSLVQVQIYSLKTNSTIPYYPYSPSQSGYTWACLDISFKNLGTGTLDTNSLYGYLKDDQAYSYRGRSLANDPQDLKLLEIKSGDIQRGNLYFEIPSSANIVSFYWSDYSSNILISLSSSPTPSPSPSATPTLTTQITPQPTTQPTQIQTNNPTTNPTIPSTQNPTSTSAPTPTIPEHSLSTVICLIPLVTLLLVVVQRKIIKK